MTAPLSLTAPATTAKPRKTRARTVPVCAACGRRLRKARYALHSDGLSYFGLDRPGERHSMHAGVPVLTSDGGDPSRGDYGDNAVCGQRCGHALAIRILVSIPGVLALLPAQWRHR